MTVMKIAKIISVVKFTGISRVYLNTVEITHSCDI